MDTIIHNRKQPLFKFLVRIPVNRDFPKSEFIGLQDFYDSENSLYILIIMVGV